jgi:hypothetical protein
LESDTMISTGQQWNWRTGDATSSPKWPSNNAVNRSGEVTRFGSG